MRRPTIVAPFNLRLPPDLKQRLDKAARGKGRTLTAEILQRLQATFTDFPTRTLEEIADQLMPAVEMNHAENVLGDLLRALDAWHDARRANYPVAIERTTIDLDRAAQVADLTVQQAARRRHTTGARS
jgi:hypothetical protein